MKKKQWPGWGPGEQAEQHYLIRPRALAGGGDVRHVAEFLRASGWRDRSKPGGPLVMESTDRMVRLAYDPHVPPAGWMVYGAACGHQAQWWAHLSRQAPVEILAGLTDALTRPRSAHAPNVWAPLEEHNWHTCAEAEGAHFTATSPDGSAWMHYRHSSEGEAIWWSGAKDSQDNSWSAEFAGSTPMHLVQAFSAALASPEPVMRPRSRVPHSTRISTTSVSVLPSELSAWQQARITTARTAAWAGNTARNTRPRAAARPHAPTSHARR